MRRPYRYGLGYPKRGRPLALSFDVGGLPIWSSAVRQAIAGTADAKVMFIGNSETAGEGAGETGSAHNNGRAHSYPSQICDNHPNGLSSLIERRHIWGTGNYTGPEFAIYAPECTVGAGWASTGSGRLGGPNMVNSTTTNDLSFAYPSGGFDTVDTYWIVSAGSGICSINIDGGTPVTSNLAGANTVRVVTVTGVGLGAHTVNISRSSGGGVNYLGHVLRNSGAKKIYAHNVGAGSSKAADWIANAAPWQAFPMINTLACHLYVICLGVNDWPVTAEATYESQMQTLITQCKLTGDVLLVGAPQRSTNFAEQAAFLVRLQNLALVNNLRAPIDINAVFGGFTLANSLGWYFDSTHPNGTLGYPAWATALAPYIFGAGA